MIDLKELYKKYEEDFKKTHDKGMTPVCFSEWYENEFASNVYEIYFDKSEDITNDNYSYFMYSERKPTMEEVEAKAREYNLIHKDYKLVSIMEDTFLSWGISKEDAEIEIIEL